MLVKSIPVYEKLILSVRYHYTFFCPFGRRHILVPDLHLILTAWWRFCKHAKNTVGSSSPQKNFPGSQSS